MTRPRRLVFRLMLSGALIAAGLPAAAQSAPDGDQRPALRRLVLAVGGGEPPSLLRAQFMPGMPGMMAQLPEAAPSSMGGGMAMIMTGESTLEMMAGACTAGLFVGGVAVAVAATPIAPLSVPLVAGSAAIGCGFAMAATAAGLGGMIGWRALYTRFLK